MISQEQFVERVFDNFDNLSIKIDKNHEETNKKVTDLCNRMTKVEDGFKSHLEINEAIENLKKENSIKKSKTFYLIIGLIGAGFTAVNTIIKFV